MPYNKVLVANFLLLFAAAIWGFGFVAQRLGMNYLEPYAFNAIRFFIGALSLLPLVYWAKRQGKLSQTRPFFLLKASLPVGILLFAGASLQQVGMLYTTAAKAGFITGLYIILVPIFGLCLRHKVTLNIWLGCVIALVGLYLLSVGSDFSVNFGDFLVFIGAFFWAAHLWTIDYYAKQMTPVLLAMSQFLVCGLLSAAVAFFIETPTVSAAIQAWQPLLYAGVVSVGIAYTLQIIGQQHAHPAHAAIILSLETVFAALGGVWLLGEYLDQRALWGCALMLLGMLVSQVQLRWFFKTKRVGAK